MPPTRDQDLFTQAVDEPLHKWAVLEQELRQTKISPLEVWKEQYQRWKELYSRFREMEQATLYKAGEDGQPIKPSQQALRFHRQVITLLLHTGDACVEALVRLHLDDGDADERHNCHIRVETMLSSLRESLELWHPANKEKLDAIRNLFA